MKQARSFRMLQPGLLAAALALSASGLVFADNFVGTDFQHQTEMASKLPSPPPPDYTGYHKLNLSVLGDTAWAPDTRGAQGPVRTEALDPQAEAAAMQAQEHQHDIDIRLGPVGGRNTF